MGFLISYICVLTELFYMTWIEFSTRQRAVKHDWFMKVFYRIAVSLGGWQKGKIQAQTNSWNFYPNWPLQGALRIQKSKTHLLGTRSSKVLIWKSGAGQNIAMHATTIAMVFFLLISTRPVQSPTFFPKPLSRCFFFFLCVSLFIVVDKWCRFLCRMSPEYR